MTEPSASAHALYQCLLEMGDSSTNPVLSVIPDDCSINQADKYPYGNLCFAGRGIKAYYHIHAEPYTRPAEHGHFHVFLETADSQWTHLSGLSMDYMGQPRGWFMVNNWVTGGPWLRSDEMSNLLSGALESGDDDFGVVEKWLFLMLQVYREQLVELLEHRDHHLLENLAGREAEVVLEDREIYDLSSAHIDLGEMIEKKLTA